LKKRNCLKLDSIGKEISIYQIGPMKNVVNLLLYFILVVIVFGASGVWMPVLLNKLVNRPNQIEDIYQNMSTYFITIIAAGCIDLILTSINNKAVNNKTGLVLFILIVLFGSLFLIGLDFYFILNGKIESAELSIIIGTSIAFLLWWISNLNNDKINSFNAVGGEIN